MALLMLAGLPSGAFAGGAIRAHLDASGKVVFVNDAQTPEPAKNLQTDPPTSTLPPVDRARSEAVSPAGVAPGGQAAPSKPAAVPAGTPAASAVSRRILATTVTQSDGRSAYVVFEDQPAPPEQLPGNDPSERFDELIEQVATEHQLDPDLLRAVIQVESNFNPYAVSPRGARGLMQLIPATARRFGINNTFDPRSNVTAGARYLKYLMSLFNGDLRLSLAAYNAGEDVVAKRGGIPPYRETQNYLRKIDEIYPLRPLPGGLAPQPGISRFTDERGVAHFSNTDQR